MKVFINKSQGYPLEDGIGVNQHYERIIEKLFPNDVMVIENVDDVSYSGLILIEVF